MRTSKVPVSRAMRPRVPILPRRRAVRRGSATVGEGAGAALAGGVRRSTRARPRRAETVCRQGGYYAMCLNFKLLVVELGNSLGLFSFYIVLFVNCLLFQ